MNRQMKIDAATAAIKGGSELIETCVLGDNRTQRGRYEIDGQRVAVATAVALMDRGTVKKAEQHARPYRHCPEDERYMDFHWVAVE